LPFIRTQCLSHDGIDHGVLDILRLHRRRLPTSFLLRSHGLGNGLRRRSLLRQLLRRLLARLILYFSFLNSDDLLAFEADYLPIDLF
jgi:hypothetical protein